MHQAQVLVYETDSKLAAQLADVTARAGFRLREVRKADACLNCLRRYGPGVLVLRLGRDLERELALLERVTWLFPDTAAIVVSETANATLAALAWDLGARFVLSAPQPLEMLVELVESVMPGKAADAERQVLP
jgi:DNA-binding NtrC family response regulator